MGHNNDGQAAVAFVVGYAKHNSIIRPSEGDSRLRGANTWKAETAANQWRWRETTDVHDGRLPSLAHNRITTTKLVS